MEPNPYEAPKEQGYDRPPVRAILPTRALALGGLMILGAGVGFIAAPFLVVAVHGYDHGHQTEEMAVWTIPGGALLGMAFHLVRTTLNHK